MPQGFCKRCQAPIDPFETVCASCKDHFRAYQGRTIGRRCERCGRPTAWDRLCGDCSKRARSRRNK